MKDDSSPDHPRNPQEVLDENRDLRVAVANLTAQLNALKALNNDRQQLGTARSMCTPFGVVAGDTSNRESIGLQAGQNVRDGMEVISSAGIVGRVEGPGLLGARVRLITDTGFALVCSFTHFKNGKYAQAPLSPTTVVGVGNGMMASRMVRMEDAKAAEISENDWVVLDDKGWPEVLQGYRVGRVTSISPRRDAPGFAEIKIEPPTNLMQLHEVMVMNRK